MRVFLRIAYDGTAYHGWQYQENQSTVEGELRSALKSLLGVPVETIGASRTDAGVHALGNVAVFDTDSSIPADRMVFAINERLPEDIRIMESREVSPDFNPRFDALNKTYTYSIWDARLMPPTRRLYTYHTKQALDAQLMKQAAGYFIGEQDFTSVSSVHAQTKSFVRTIYSLEVNRAGSDVLIRINGNGFLYNMVRIISGTLVHVGLGKIKPETVGEILAAKNRTLAGPTLPAQGLTLEVINY